MDITISYIMKISHKQIELLDVVCKGFQFKGYNDTKTIITRAEAKEAGNLLKELKEEILLNYPYDYTLKLKATNEFDAKSSLTVLRQLMRYHRRRLVSIRGYKYCKTKKRGVTTYRYNLL